jgi:hypothetical protein
VSGVIDQYDSKHSPLGLDGGPDGSTELLRCDRAGADTGSVLMKNGMLCMDEAYGQEPVTVVQGSRGLKRCIDLSE